MNIGQIRAAALHVATFTGGTMAAVTYLASNSVDLYSAWDHIHIAFQEMLKAWAIVVPIGAAAFAVYKNNTRVKLIDATADPAAPAAAATIQPTTQVVAVADALKKQ